MGEMQYYLKEQIVSTYLGFQGDGVRAEENICQQHDSSVFSYLLKGL